MLPSISYGNDPISYTDPSIFNKPFFNDIISNSKHDHDLPFSFHFPSPFIHYENDDVFLHQHLDLLPQQQQQPFEDDKLTISETNTNNVLDAKKGNEQIPSRRTLKRDRHSKINTAQGPRDRRMRLSLEVAREFFGLQDMLGFDKASKTIEWLLTQAKTEIKELAKGIRRVNYTCNASAKSASSTSECEVVSGTYEKQGCISNSEERPSKSVNKVKRVRKLRKTAFHPPLAKETREKARARARERTRELWSRRFDEPKLCDEATKGDLKRLCSFETGDESCTHSHNLNPLLELMAEVEQPRSHEQEEPLGVSEAINDDSWVLMGKWSPMFNYMHNTVNPQEHQFTDHQFFSKC